MARVQQQQQFRAALATVLRMKLAELAMNPTDLTRKVGLSLNTVRRTLMGERSPDVFELRLIADVLGEPYQVLVERADQYLAALETDASAVRQQIGEELG